MDMSTIKIRNEDALFDGWRVDHLISLLIYPDHTTPSSGLFAKGKRSHFIFVCASLSNIFYGPATLSTISITFGFLVKFPWSPLPCRKQIDSMRSLTLICSLSVFDFDDQEATESELQQRMINILILGISFVCLL